MKNIINQKHKNMIQRKAHNRHKITHVDRLTNIYAVATKLSRDDTIIYYREKFAELKTETTIML